MKNMALQQVADWMKAKLDEIEAMRDNEVTADAVLAEVIDLFAMEVGESESEDAILYMPTEGLSYFAITPETSPLLYKWLVAKMREEMADIAEAQIAELQQALNEACSLLEIDTFRGEERVIGGSDIRASSVPAFAEYRRKWSSTVADVEDGA